MGTQRSSSLSPWFGQDQAPVVFLGKKSNSPEVTRQEVCLNSNKQHRFAIWLPGARHLPPWWHLWISPQGNFWEIHSYSAPVPLFAALRLWTTLFMDSNGTFFFQNNCCIIVIMPLIMCYSLSNTWVVNNSWFPATWSIVRADWNLPSNHSGVTKVLKEMKVFTAIFIFLYFKIATF